MMQPTLRRLLPFAVLFLAIETLLRLSLLARAFLDVEFEYRNIVGLLARGVWFDVVTLSFVIIPVALYVLCFSPRRMTEIVLRFVFIFILLFDAVAEHLFWIEFTTRFNFIAVDYLIYTQEVIGNIVESYPLYWLISGITLSAALFAWGTAKIWPVAIQYQPLRTRAAAFAALLAVCFGLYSASSIEQSQFPNNAEAGELVANGMYNLLYAFWNNEIRYDRFYISDSKDDAVHNARNLLWEEDWPFVHKEGDDLTRIVRAHGKEQHKNVILVVMESMSADYMGTFGNKDNLTPNLDRLAREGLLFSDTYATGTRTVRGLEAVTLSIPPTPGQSIIRRPGNENLFSLGFIFKDRGYDTKFIYGGYGYFDNMNAFFAGNGFDTLDRTRMSREETHFTNVWGICDEDMFERAIHEADASHAAGKPFLYLIMTTSNHRPYTYPDGRIDIPSHSGRFGGVKYADYSVGKLIKEAGKKPWFKDTVFVFVADHTAGAGGKAELNPAQYHIPMIFYAPGFVNPSRYAATASQIDLSPILLGMLNFSYYTKFYGEDLLNDSDEIPHAFISNYQKVALIKNKQLTVLLPKRKVESYTWPNVELETESDVRRVEDAITYYQSASWWKDRYKRISTVITPEHAVARVSVK